MSMNGFDDGLVIFVEAIKEMVGNIFRVKGHTEECKFIYNASDFVHMVLNGTRAFGEILIFGI